MAHQEERAPEAAQEGSTQQTPEASQREAPLAKPQVADRAMLPLEQQTAKEAREVRAPKEALRKELPLETATESNASCCPCQRCGSRAPCAAA